MKKIQEVNNPVRLKPISPSLLEKQYGDVLTALPGKSMKGQNSPSNVFGILLHSPEIAKDFIPYWVKSKDLLSIDHREQELIILKMACLFGSPYVWGHHAVVALEVGVTQEEVSNIPRTIDEGNWSNKDKALFLATEWLVKTANLTEEQWNQVSKFYSPKQILDIITVVSQYLLFNAVNNVFGVQLEHNKFPAFPTKS